MLRVSEVYTSIQGEGPNVGQPTQFMRFGGCNLRCPGWPCDTQHAIDPKYRNEWERYEVDGVIARVDPWPRRITLTGGEPFLQPLNDLKQLCDWAIRMGYSIDVFTNGTINWPDWVGHYGLQLITDWKLPGSGEDPFDAKRIANVQETPNVFPKFTVASRFDYDTAVGFMDTYTLNPTMVYIGAVWGKVAESTLADWIMKDKLDVNFNVQVHNYIWDRDERGR